MGKRKDRSEHEKRHDLLDRIRSELNKLEKGERGKLDELDKKKNWKPKTIREHFSHPAIVSFAKDKERGLLDTAEKELVALDILMDQEGFKPSEWGWMHRRYKKVLRRVQRQDVRYEILDRPALDAGGRLKKGQFKLETAMKELKEFVEKEAEK